MVHKTIELSQKLSTLNIDNTVLDFYKIKPLNLDEIRKFIKEFEYIATIEEHSFVGGLGSLFSEIICDGDLNTKLIRFGLKDEQCFVIGGGKTYFRFAPYITHIYVTPHPYVFGEGVPLFDGTPEEMKLVFEKLITVSDKDGIYQYQYKVLKQ